MFYKLERKINSQAMKLDKLSGIIWLETKRHEKSRIILKTKVHKMEAKVKRVNLGKDMIVKYLYKEEITQGGWS